MLSEKLLSIYMHPVFVGEIYQSENGNKYLVAGDGKNIFLVVIESPIPRGECEIGRIYWAEFHAIGFDFESQRHFGIVNKDAFLSVYKKTGAKNGG